MSLERLLESGLKEGKGGRPTALIKPSKEEEDRELDEVTRRHVEQLHGRKIEEEDRKVFWIDVGNMSTGSVNHLWRELLELPAVVLQTWH